MHVMNRGMQTCLCRLHSGSFATLIFNTFRWQPQELEPPNSMPCSQSDRKLLCSSISLNRPLTKMLATLFRAVIGRRGNTLQKGRSVLSIFQSQPRGKERVLLSETFPSYVGLVFLNEHQADLRPATLCLVVFEDKTKPNHKGNALHVQNSRFCHVKLHSTLLLHIAKASNSKLTNQLLRIPHSKAKGEKRL